jgi:LmbE family N-acetylglucosaminyl deacetylase
VIRLKLPDRYVSDYDGRLFDFLKTVVDEETILVAPWSRDPHSDHEACGRVAERICAGKGSLLVSYLFWTWHWGSPGELRRQPIRRFELDLPLQQAKQAALAEHHSQLMRAKGDPILPKHFLLPAKRSFETFIVHEY